MALGRITRSTRVTLLTPGVEELGGTGTSTSVGSGSMFLREPTDLCVTALDRLLEQFKGKPKLEAWIISYCRQLEDARSALRAMLVNRTVDGAQGEQLDGIGRIVGQPRGNRLDDLYRLLIKARIKANNSDGEADDLIEIVQLVVPDGVVPLYTDTPPAAFEIEAVGGLLSCEEGSALAILIRQAKPAGVRMLFKWRISEPIFTYTASGLFEAASPEGYDTGVYLAGSDGTHEHDCA